MRRSVVVFTPINRLTFLHSVGHQLEYDERNYASINLGRAAHANGRHRLVELSVHSAALRKCERKSAPRKAVQQEPVS